MASADVTLGSDPFEFEADASVHTAAVNRDLGWLRNQHATELAYVNFQNTTVVVAQPVGIGGVTLKPGQITQIPANCRAFKFKAAASTFIQYSPNQLL